MGDIIVLAVLGLILALVIFSMVRERKKGSSCSCGCAGCEKKSLCHPEKTDQE